MRPVRLELNGFAGFRVATVVDFTDADYFALVGSTGSGKSTILDALTFALYGTAYRWGRSNAISYALAPTSNRCTVSLTFDVASQRYQVAREVRRIGGRSSRRPSAWSGSPTPPRAPSTRTGRNPRSWPARSRNSTPPSNSFSDCPSTTSANASSCPRATSPGSCRRTPPTGSGSC